MIVTNVDDWDNNDVHRPVIAPANDNRCGAWVEYDAEGRAIRVVRARDPNPLKCDVTSRAASPARAAVPLTAATLARHRTAAWRASAPANDSDIFGRAPRNKGGHELSGFTSELGWWRAMTNSPSNFDVITSEAANDDDEAVASVERENEEIRPSVSEILRCVPPIQRVAVRSFRRSTGWSKTARKVHLADVEWKNGRIARVSGLKFSTVTKWVPDQVEDRLPDRVLVRSARRNNGWSGTERTTTFATQLKPTNVAGPVSRMPRAGTLLAYRPSGRRGWSLPTEHAREHRGGQGDRNSAYMFLLAEQPMQPTEPAKTRQHTNPTLAAAWLAEQGHRKFSVDASFRSWLRAQDFAPMTRHPVGLPYSPTRLKDLFMSGRTTPGAGTKDGSGQFDRVRRQNEIDGQHTISVTEENDVLAGFRAAHANHAAILDCAMTAKNMSDIAQSAGASSPHTGKRLLMSACDALREYRKKYAYGLQNLPSRAA